MTQVLGGFAALELHPNILAAVIATGYEEPSAIQAMSIPVILAGEDMIGQAQTGTGKTAAFALPILSRIDPAKREPQALILAPTRELALQVASAFETYAKQMPGVNVIAVYGGAPMGPQLKAIRNGAQIIVATPGRLVDHMRRDEKVLSTVRHLVLDEADEMLKLGFMDDLEVIFKGIPAERQTVLFSATLPHSIRAIAEKHLRTPKHVKVETKTQTVTAIEQAQDFARSIHEMTMAGLTGMMITGTVGLGDFVGGMRAFLANAHQVSVDGGGLMGVAQFSAGKFFVIVGIPFLFALVAGIASGLVTGSRSPNIIRCVRRRIRKSVTTS